MTKLTPARKTSKLCNGTPDECRELLDSVPNFDEYFEYKSPQDVARILDEHLNGGHNEESAETDSKETVKYGKEKPASSIDSAFADLMA